jgi:imidazolonepropionase-like amidohydrolase
VNKLVLRNGRLIDGTGEMPRDDWGILVEGARISAVAPSASLPAEAGAEVIDVQGMTIMPGLIDAHTHLTYHAEEQSRMLQQMTETIEMNTIRAVLNAKQILDTGCTAIGDGGSRGNIATAIRDAVAKQLIPGPKVVAAGQIISGTAGLVDYTTPWGKLHDETLLGVVVDGPAEVRETVREQVRSGVDWVKVSASGGPTRLRPWIPATTQDLEYDELLSAVQEAAKFGKNVHAHAHDTNGLKDAVRAGVISLHSGEYVDDEGLELMRERGCVFVPTIAWLHFSVDESYMRDFTRSVKLSDQQIANCVASCRDAYEHCREAIQNAYRMGVPLGIGSDAAHTFPPFDLVREMEYFQDLGIPPLQIITCATKVSAQAVGRADAWGTLEPGKAADVLVVAGDPAEDIRILRDKSRIVVIIQDGRVIKQTAHGPSAVKAQPVASIPQRA